MNRALTALLGTLAVAGYQNRDKLREMLGGLGQRTADDNNTSVGGLGGLLGGLTSGNGLGSLLQGGGIGQLLSGGLGGLIDQFSRNGHGDTARSWVESGPNAPIDDRQISEALGADVLRDLSNRTGLTPEEIATRLSRDLPRAVDDLTPDGKLPASGGGEMSRA